MLDKIKRRILHTHLVFTLVMISTVYIVLAFPDIDERISAYPILFVGVPTIVYLFGGVKPALWTLAVSLFFYLPEPLDVIVLIPFALINIMLGGMKKRKAKREKDLSWKREETIEGVNKEESNEEESNEETMPVVEKNIYPIEDLDGESPSPFEERKPFISSKMLGIGICILSMLSVSLIVLGIRHQILFFVLMLWPIVSTMFYYLRQEDIMFSGAKHGKPSAFIYYLYNPILTCTFSWMVMIYIIQCNCLARRPHYWIIGFLGMILFFIFTIFSIKEIRNKMGVKMGMALISVIFGLQITGVLFLMSHY